MRCDLPHQEMLNGCAFNGCRWPVLHYVTTSDISSGERNIWIPYTSCRAVLFCHRVTSVYFTRLLLGLFQRSEHSNHYCTQTFSHPSLGLHYGNLLHMLSMKQERLHFPLSPLGYIQMGIFFSPSSSQQDKVIKSWKQTLKEALSKKIKAFMIKHSYTVQETGNLWGW